MYTNINVDKLQIQNLPTIRVSYSLINMKKWGYLSHSRDSMTLIAVITI